MRIVSIKYVAIQPLSCEKVSGLFNRAFHKPKIDEFADFFSSPSFLKLQISSGEVKSAIEILKVNQILSNAQLRSLL